jgi:hypothetical protein
MLKSIGKASWQRIKKMNNLNDRVAELKSEAVAILDSFFEIPEGHSNGKTNRLVDCLVSAALLETANVMRDAQETSHE